MNQTYDIIITRDEAIEAMRKGEKCETSVQGFWRTTQWAHFDDVYVMFRRPPEPRREAREFWVFPDGGAVYEHHVPGAVRVREVLPGEALVKRMTQKELEEFCIKHGISMPGYPNARVCMVFADALGLLIEEDTNG